MTHRLPVRVYYEDTDMAGIVYYANYLKYIERGRSELVEELGMNQREMREKDGIVFVVVRVEADYLKPARIDDRLEVVTTHEAVSPMRWVFDQDVQRDGVSVFRAKVTAVCMTVEGKPTRLPAELRAKLG
jgi:acyl-CoA thioester hydrolase